MRRIVGVAVVIWLILVSACLWGGNHDRAARGLEQEPAPGTGGAATFKTFQTDNPFRGDVWTTVFIGDVSSAVPPPPGVARVPSVGQTYVSPAVAAAIKNDPAVAGRVPGKIVGTIASAGLQSPDQYYVLAGRTPAPDWWHAHGWGGVAVQGARPTIPQGALLGILAVLIGMPALMLAWSAGRMAATARQRTTATLHLLGVERRALSTAAAIDAGCGATLGSVAGGVLAVATVAATHASTVMGYAWYPPATLVPIPWWVLAWLAVTVIVAVDAARSVTLTAENPLASSSGAPRRLRRWPAVLAALAVAGMAGVVVSHWFGASLSPGTTILYFFIGGPLGLLGVTVGMPALLEWRARRLLRRGEHNLLVARRLSWRRDSVAASVLGATLIAMGGLVGAGIIADLNGLTPSLADGDLYAVQAMTATELDHVLAVPAPASYLEIDNQHHTTKIVSCASLGRILVLAGVQGEPVVPGCQDHREQIAVSKGSPDGDHLLVNGLGRTTLTDATVIVTKPRAFARTAEYQRLGGQATVMVAPGAGGNAIDQYFNRVLTAAPDAEVTDLSADEFQPMVAPTKRLFLISTGAGLVIALVLMLLSSLDAQQRARSDDARLAVLGADRAFISRVHAATYGHGLITALVAGLLLGFLTGSVYDIAGALAGGPGRLGVEIAIVTAAIGTAATLIMWFFSRRSTFTNPIADLRTE